MSVHYFLIEPHQQKIKMSGFSPINNSGSMDSKFKPIEEAWFDKTKKDKLFGNWKRRFFSLDMENKTLSYYADEEKSDFKGAVVLNDASNLQRLSNNGSYSNIIEVSGTAVGKGDAVLVISADSVEMRDYWYSALSECIRGNNKSFVPKVMSII